MKRTPFAVGSTDPRLHVRLDHVMPLMYALVDHVPMRRFGNETTLYIIVDDAIAWVQQEHRATEKPELLDLLAVLRRAKSNHEHGRNQYV